MLRLYDGALTDQQIADLFSATSANVPEPSSIAIWSLLGLVSFTLVFRRMRRKSA